MKYDRTKGTIALVIPSLTDFVPARNKSLAVLVDQLNAGADTRPRESFTILRDREPPWVWWRRALDVAHAEGRALLLLQDDVRVSPRFWATVDAMREAKPGEVICLLGNHPGARKLWSDGIVRWYSTVDGYIGPGGYWPGEVVSDMREWLDHEVEPRMISAVNEDDMAGLYLLARGRPILNPVVSPIDHDLSVASTYGNDNHRQRRPAVTWHDAEREGDRTDYTSPKAWNTTVANFGRYYRESYLRLRLVLKDKALAEKLIGEVAEKTCPKQYARFFAWG